MNQKTLGTIALTVVAVMVLSRANGQVAGFVSGGNRYFR